MLRGILIIATVGLLGVLLHRRDKLEEKVFKNIPLSDWLIILVFPLLLYLGWVAIVRNIMDRPDIGLFPLDDFDILALTILFFVYGFVGVAIHFTSKILWRYLKLHKYLMAYRVNEMFHGKLSHYLSYLNALFIIFLLSILEINHPLSDPVSTLYKKTIMFAGVIFGISSSKSIFYTNEWFGGYNKPLFFLVTILLSILIIMLKFFKLTFSFYPVNLFVATMFSSIIVTFITRQIFIFSKLSNKKKLRFLTKMLHV